MSLPARPAIALTVARCAPGERRDRSAAPSGLLVGSVPFFERDPSGSPAATHRPAAVPGLPLAQLIELAATGVWVARRDGVLIAIGGRDHWCSHAALTAAATAAGVPVSDIAIRTNPVL